MKKFKLVASIIVFACSSMLSIAQEKSPISNERFLQEAEMGHMNGVALCILGKEKIKNDRLRKYSVLTYSDFLSANKKLKELAKKKKFDLPDLLPEQTIDADEISAISLEVNDNDVIRPLKNPFDQSFLQMMIEDFQSALAFYENSAQSADQDIQLYANEMLPVIKKNISEGLKFTQQTLAKQ